MGDPHSKLTIITTIITMIENEFIQSTFSQSGADVYGIANIERFKNALLNAGYAWIPVRNRH